MCLYARQNIVVRVEFLFLENNERVQRPRILHRECQRVERCRATKRPFHVKRRLDETKRYVQEDISLCAINLSQSPGVFKRSVLRNCATAYCL